MHIEDLKRMYLARAEETSCPDVANLTETSHRKENRRSASSTGSWFNPRSHHAVMCINSKEITRVDVRAKCICSARWIANSSTTHSNHHQICLSARMSLTHEILCFQQRDRQRDTLPCCNEYAGSLCPCQCGLRHHTCNTEDPCRHSCHTFRCSHRSTGHYFRLPLVFTCRS